jgi:hypothetical protein
VSHTDQQARKAAHQGKYVSALPSDLFMSGCLCLFVQALQDINTGSVRHTDQQARKAAYHGTYVAAPPSIPAIYA